jgi:hypothetical protein
MCAGIPDQDRIALGFCADATATTFMFGDTYEFLMFAPAHKQAEKRKKAVGRS